MIIIVLTAEYPEISKHVDGIAHQVTGKPYLTHISVTQISSVLALQQSLTFKVMESDGDSVTFTSTTRYKQYPSISTFYEEVDELYEAHKPVLLKKSLGVS